MSRLKSQWFSSAVFLGAALLLLSHCATKHQPAEFPPYFASRPETEFSSAQADERRALELVATPTAFQKKRMIELYLNEQRFLKPGTPRYLELDIILQKLKPDIADLDQEVSDLQTELKSQPIESAEGANAKSSSVFQNPVGKKGYVEALQLWKFDDMDGAIKRASDVLGDSKVSLSDEEKLKLYYLKERVWLEKNDLVNARIAYDAMRAISDCDADTTQAAFLLAVRTFAQGEGASALKLLSEQCDKDKSLPNLQRRTYWTARFQEGQGTHSTTIYQNLAATVIPSYYSFLAQIRLGHSVSVPTPGSKTRAFLSGDLDVSSRIHQLWTSAEDRIRQNLRRDAMMYLLTASRILRKDPGASDIPALLYTAHLCQAAGNHLEALRIYSQVSAFAGDPEVAQTIVSGPLFSEVFPRPFADKIDWISKVWQVDSDLVYSLIRQESAFSPTAVSGSDARGLMQLIPPTALTLAKQWSYRSYYTDRSLFNAAENLKLGIFYVHQLQEVTHHPALIAAAYNAGPTRAMVWWNRYGNLPLDVFVELIPVNETRNYVKLVTRNYFYYKWLRTGQPVSPTLLPFSLGSVPKEYAETIPSPSKSIQSSSVFRSAPLN